MKKDYSKIKNIIFDLDNTIILNSEKDAEGYKTALSKLGYNEEDFWGIYVTLDKYEKTFSEEKLYCNKEDLLNLINESLGKDYKMELLDEINKIIGNEWTKKTLISEETLLYLSKKYNLYVYTNYFQEVQSQRINKIGYTSYFKKIFGADRYGMKPFRKSFENVLNAINANPEECLMIGDNKRTDIKAANNIGMKSILVDFNGKRDLKEVDVNNYIVITELKELENIL